MTPTKDNILSLLDNALGRSPADSTELVYIGLRDVTTRFAENRIHQNMVSGDGRVVVRLVKDGRVAVSSTNDLTDEGLDRAVADAAHLLDELDAVEIAGFLDPDEGLPALVKSAPAKSVESFVSATDQCPPPRRARAVAEVAGLANDAKVQSSGLFRLKTNRIAVANSTGTRQYHEETVAEFSVSAADDAALGQRRVHDAHVAELVEQAARRPEHARPRDRRGRGTRDRRGSSRRRTC